MTTLAIDCEGYGTVYRFKTVREGFLHPVIQYGDPVMDGPGDLLLNYNALEWGELCEFAGVVADCPRTEQGAAVVWSALVRVAVGPPATLQGVIDAVRVGRTAVTRRQEMAKKTRTADGGTVESAAKVRTVRRSSDPAPAPAAGRFVPVDDGYTLDHLISIGVNKDGASYKDAVPYREDSKRAERFALVQEGMTLGQAIDAGVKRRHLKQMADAGFIVISAPDPVAAAA